MIADMPATALLDLDLDGTTWDAIVDRRRPGRSDGRAAAGARRGKRAAGREETVSAPKGLRRLLEPDGALRARLGRPGFPCRGARRSTLSEFHLRFRGRSLRMPMSGGSVVSRERLDEALAEAAVEAGSRFLDGTLAPSTASPGGLRQVLLTRARAMRDVCQRARSWSRPAWESASVPSEEPPRPAGFPPARESARAAGSRAVPEPTSTTPCSWRVGAGGYVGIVRVEDGSLNVAAAFDPALVRQRRERRQPRRSRCWPKPALRRSPGSQAQTGRARPA